jgi:hypothetical protein
MPTAARFGVPAYLREAPCKTCHPSQMCEDVGRRSSTGQIRDGGENIPGP